MSEKTFNTLAAKNFKAGAGNTAESRLFRSQMETLAHFMAGGVPIGEDQVTMNIGGRPEIWHRHEAGYANGKVRILKIGAHPDDTGLDSGAAYLAVKLGKDKGVKKTRLAVITATPGQKGKQPDGLQIPLEEARIEEDIKGTGLLGADFLANLGFMDGDLPNNKNLLTGRLTQYIAALQPQIVILPDPEDPAHDDHIAVSHAAVEALIDTKQKPIVVYKEFQNGNRKFTKDHVAYRLQEDEYQAVQDAFLIHMTQTSDPSADIEELLGRPFRNAEIFGFDVPIGVFRQDNRFSQEPFGNYLGDRIVSLSDAEKERAVIDRKIRELVQGPIDIFDASKK